MYVIYMHVGAVAMMQCVEIRGHGISSPPFVSFHCGFWESKSGHQASQQVLLATEQSYWPLFFNS